MASDGLKAAASAGQPKALEALMNQSFGKQGITARVIKSGALLRVTLSSKQLPDQKTADLVKKGIASIKPQGISKVSLKGEQIGGRESWTTEWNLAGDSPKVATVVSSQGKTKKWYQRTAVVIPGVLGVIFLLSGLGSLMENPEQADTEAEAVEVAEAPPEIDYLAQGKQQGYEAAVAAQNAEESQWSRVSEMWGWAIGSLRLIPVDHPDYAAAQAKIAEYSANQAAASRRADAYKASITPPAEKTQIPTGNYNTYTANAGLTGTTEIQWRWLKGAELDCDYGTCWGVEVIAPEGCDNALYIELAMEDESDVNIGMTNDTTGKLRPGQKARMVFNTFDESAHSAGISEMSCY